MIKLKINGECDELFLRIRKDNHILIEGELGYMNFYLLFYRLIKDKQNNLGLNGYLDDRLINNKDFILINLTDLEEILAIIQYKKGNLLFDYINMNLLEKLSIIDNNFYNQIDTIIEGIAQDLGVDYQLEENSLKLIQTLIQISVSSSDYFSILKTVNKILCKILSTVDNKKYIVFYNSNIIDIDFSQYQNCYSFDINQQLEISKYNMLSTNKIKEFHLDMIQEQVKLLWPMEYTNEVICYYLKRYFKYYLGFKEVELTDKNEIIIASIIKKIFDFNQLIVYDSSLLEYNIKSFLTDL